MSLVNITIAAYVGCNKNDHRQKKKGKRLLREPKGDETLVHAKCLCKTRSTLGSDGIPVEPACKREGRR